MKYRHLLPVGAVLAVTVGVGYLVHLRRVQEPLRSFSDRALEAIDARDGATLAEMMYPAERRATELDSRKIGRLIDWFRASVRDFKIEDRSFRADKDRDAVAAVERYYRAPDGRETTLSLYVVRTENGPQLFLTHALVTGALLAKYRGRFMNEPDQVAHWKAIQTGLAAERPFFESLPLRGVTDTGGEATFLPWAQWARFADRTIRDQEKAYEQRKASGQS
ncbi:hypothetical protein EON79_05460 [bacterium]|nr:MAG: hypothetical protein EON79_05460 [bacterium]